ncbi:MAG: hypothetical protein C0622_08460 [Desulfuromonas sp.]|nr:MAG: hypothetical protein C0622_08460 [Desulfuromonas sp.]
MILDTSVAITWILFIALFPCTFIWLRRAWRIFVRKNYSEVALKHGAPPANPKKWAPVVGLLNLLCGGVTAWIIIAIAVFVATGIELGMEPSFKTWNAYGGLTICGKIMADFIIRLQAHPIVFGKKKKQATA